MVVNLQLHYQCSCTHSTTNSIVCRQTWKSGIRHLLSSYLTFLFLVSVIFQVCRSLSYIKIWSKKKKKKKKKEEKQKQKDLCWSLVLLVCISPVVGGAVRSCREPSCIGFIIVSCLMFEAFFVSILLILLLLAYYTYLYFIDILICLHRSHNGRSSNCKSAR